MDKLLREVASLLTEKELTIATAESCTGGLIGHVLTTIPGSSAYYVGGVIAYTNALKIKLLGVAFSTLEEYGAVSESTAQEMAEGIKTVTQADVGIASTGIAGPSGGTAEKPVGLVYIGLATEVTTVKAFVFDGDRLQNQKATVQAVLQMVLDCIPQHD